MVFATVLEPVFNPLINSVGSFWFVAIISFIVSIIIVLAYKYTTDQNLMKTLKEDIKKLNKDARALMKDPNTQQKAMAIHKQIMEKQMTMMKHSMKSTLVTFLPIIIIFGWMTANLAFIPLTEDSQFTVSVEFDDYIGDVELVVPDGFEIIGESKKEITDVVEWRLSGVTGEYLLEWNVGENNYFKDIIITDEQKYAEPIKQVKDGIVNNIQINYKKNVLLNLFGWRMGWLATYIIFSIVLNGLLRKLLKVY